MKYFLLILVLISSFIYGQELNCKITVNLEKLSGQSKDNLANFSTVVEDYMNKTRFTSERWEGGKIECAFNILLQTGSDNGNSYTAQIIVTSQRPIYKSTDNSLMLSINDNAWSFTYIKDQPLVQNQSVYDPVTSLLDYYAYVILGMDADSYEKLGGTRFFTKALDLVNLGATSSFSNGWQNSSATYSRRGLVEDILSDKYRPFREAFFDYHYNGIDIYQFKKDIALYYITKLVTTLEALRTKIDIRSVYIKVFFDAKNGELVQYLKEAPNKSELAKTLKRIDPSHAVKYDEITGGL
jgi:hypothetical protein